MLTTLGAQCCAAEEAGISARHHSWARFQPGAWKLVRVVTESLDESGRVIGVNITETKTSLLRIDADGVVLEVEVGVEVAGKQFDGQPQCLKQGFHGELAGGDVKFLPAAAAEVSIEDQKFPCRSQQIEVRRFQPVELRSTSFSPIRFRLIFCAGKARQPTPAEPTS